jgi:ALIX V-shaped domain binding to HIV
MQKIEPAQFEGLFEERLEDYDVDWEILTKEEEDQEELSGRVQEANAAFVSARKGDSSTREREKALQELENGYLKYKEIISNLDVGRKFYNDLANIVTRFRDSCKAFVNQRRVEASHLESYGRLSTTLYYLTDGDIGKFQHQPCQRSASTTRAPHYSDKNSTKHRDLHLLSLLDMSRWQHLSQLVHPSLLLGLLLACGLLRWGLSLGLRHRATKILTWHHIRKRGRTIMPTGMSLGQDLHKHGHESGHELATAMRLDGDCHGEMCLLALCVPFASIQNSAGVVYLPHSGGMIAGQRQQYC